jgi:hypothetical protein
MTLRIGDPGGWRLRRRISVGCSWPKIGRAATTDVHCPRFEFFQPAAGQGTSATARSTLSEGHMLKRALRVAGVLTASILIATLVIVLVEMSGVNLVTLAE